MTEVRINGFDELVNYLRTSDLNRNQAADIIGATYKVFFLKPETKAELIDAFIDYWNQYSERPQIERPIFFDLDIDVVE